MNNKKQITKYCRDCIYFNQMTCFYSKPFELQQGKEKENCYWVEANKKDWDGFLISIGMV